MADRSRQKASSPAAKEYVVYVQRGDVNCEILLQFLMRRGLRSLVHVQRVDRVPHYAWLPFMSDVPSLYRLGTNEVFQGNKATVIEIKRFYEERSREPKYSQDTLYDSSSWFADDAPSHDADNRTNTNASTRVNNTMSNMTESDAGTDPDPVPSRPRKNEYVDGTKIKAYMAMRNALY